MIEPDEKVFGMSQRSLLGFSLMPFAGMKPNTVKAVQVPQTRQEFTPVEVVLDQTDDMGNLRHSAKTTMAPGEIV